MQMFVTFNKSLVKLKLTITINKASYFFTIHFAKNISWEKTLKHLQNMIFLTVVTNHGSSFIFIFAQFVKRKWKASYMKPSFLPSYIYRKTLLNYFVMLCVTSLNRLHHFFDLKCYTFYRLIESNCYVADIRSRLYVGL